MLETFTNRLSAITSSMGEASNTEGEGEHLLFLLPFPEPHEILDKLRKKHPKLTIVYRSVYFSQGTFGEGDPVPEGKSLFS
jgi:hypothetical protein